MLKGIYKLIYNLFSCHDEKGQPNSGYFQGIIRRRIVKLCRLRKGRLLEIGQGVGLLLEKIIKNNIALKVYGIDRNLDFCIRANTRLKSSASSNFSILLADAYKPAFKENSFDIVICVNFILNISSLSKIRELLAELKYLCKPSGRIIFEFRNYENFLFRFIYRLSGYYDSTLEGLTTNCHKLKDIEHLLDSLSLKVIRREWVGIPLLGKLAPIIILEVGKI
ncbi:MAG: class I SAM-dependent methyltransferase [Candidatus Omnitrophota bacterium]